MMGMMPQQAPGGGRRGRGVNGGEITSTFKATGFDSQQIVDAFSYRGRDGLAHWLFVIYTYSVPIHTHVYIYIYMHIYIYIYIYICNIHIRHVHTLFFW